MKISIKQLKRMIKEELEGSGELEQDLNSAIDNLVLESKPRRKKVDESVGVFLGGMLAGVLLGPIKRAAVKIRDRLKTNIENLEHDEEVIALQEIEQGLMDKVKLDLELTEMLKQYEEGGSSNSFLSKEISERIVDLVREYAKELREKHGSDFDSKAIRQSPQQIRGKMKTGRRFGNLDVY
jgi:hypothetical protein